MKILLDTCTFLWIITSAPALSHHAQNLFADTENEVYLSPVCTWEIALKHALGRLPLPASPEQYIPAQRIKHGIDALPLEEEATLYLGRLPPVHKDPFDRMLICQAMAHGLIMVTVDEKVTAYPIHVL